MDAGGTLRRHVPAIARSPPRAIASFLDTNVVVYAYEAGEPRKRQIARAILASDPDGLVVSTQVLVEFYSTATRRDILPRDRAAAVVDELRRLRVIGADGSLVASAIALSRERQISLWDALIVRAAQIARCERLLTEDLQDGARFGDVTIENPFREVSTGG